MKKNIFSKLMFALAMVVSATVLSSCDKLANMDNGTFLGDMVISGPGVSDHKLTIEMESTGSRYSNGEGLYRHRECTSGRLRDDNRHPEEPQRHRRCTEPVAGRLSINERSLPKREASFFIKICDSSDGGDREWLLNIATATAHPRCFPSADP